MKLGNPKNTIEVIQKYDFDFQKKFGQNFLIDERVLEKIISAAEVNKDDFVLEIGPGIGTMTQYLAENAKEFTHPNPPKDFDWKEYPTLPMPPSYSLDPSIKIGLEDLDQIPDLDDNIKTNGFLLLNYGNFGHLMLAKDQDSGQRYLGIPGIFDNEKAFISRLFGFKTFITVPLKPHKTGNFGYFILPV